MSYPHERYKVTFRLLHFALFLCLFGNTYGQEKTGNEQDTISHIPVNQLKIRYLESLTDSVSAIPSIPVPVYISKTNETFYYHSLRERASRYRLTKKLYDIVVVNHDTTTKSSSEGRSEAVYSEYSGRLIRRIEFKRLNVFGSDIDRPDYYSPSEWERFFNKVHINTSENIIGKNLLFSAGDTVSPIQLSDNERILRELPFIDDARITLMPVSKDEVDIIVVTKDVYSIGGDYSYKGTRKGEFSVFDNNIFGIGHELGVYVPWNSDTVDSPGIGIHYLADNIGKSFINMNVYYANGLGHKTYGLDLSRRFFSTNTKYAGGISIRQMFRNVDLDTLIVPAPLKYIFQDYWLARSFLIDQSSSSRLILAGRYTNNNVFDRPYILPDSYHSYQRYMFFLSSLTFSVQKYYKANLIYGYGRTEDIPYGGLIRVTMGREINEFKVRNYAGSEIAFGKSGRFGYVYSSAGLASYINNNHTEQGIVALRVKYFSNLVHTGRYMIRNFINADYTRGFDRNYDEYLKYFNDNGFTGFRNDSTRGAQRITINLESVLFSPANFYDFRFAFFAFADFSSLAGPNEVFSHGSMLSDIGIGIRIRNNNLVFNTFQIRIGYFPDPPSYSRINNILVSGEQLLRPNNFESGPPSVIPYR
jgi:hypothetical protein